MLTTPKENSYVTSRFMRSLKNLYPKKSLKELTIIVDKQVEFWRKNKVFWKIVDCHVDVYGCSMPQIEKLLGGRIKKDVT